MILSLVVPTIRKECVEEFLKKWTNSNIDHLIVIEDNPTKTFDLNIKHHYSWKEIQEVLKDDAWIISRRDSAIKCFGFIVANKLKSDYTFALDDDCYPIGDNQDFFDKHIAQIENTPQWTSSIPGIHVRGLPYYNTGKMNNVVMNVGLWKGNIDLDAPHALVQPLSDEVIPQGNTILSNGQYRPICGMNMCFKKEMAVLTYFPLMGEGQCFRRFDDIWFGVLAQKVCDHLRLAISMGEPFIYHSKASNLFVNLIKEAPGIQFNEVFWMLIDRINLTQQTPKECMQEIGVALSGGNSPEDSDYTRLLGSAILTWCKYF